MAMVMLRQAVGSALRRPAPASRLSRRDTIRKMCSASPGDTKRDYTPELLFVTVAVLAMGSFAYIVRGRTLLGYTQVEREQVKVDKEVV